MPIEGTPRDETRPIDLERLLEVVERAELHRLDRALHRRVGRHHDDLRALAFGRRRDVLANEVEAAQLRHDVVDDQQVERAFGQEPLRLAGIRRFHDRMARVPKGASEGLEVRLLVVDEEDGLPRHGHLLPCRRRPGAKRPAA